MSLSHISESLRLELMNILDVWIWDIFLLICFPRETWDMFIFRFVYFNDLKLQMLSVYYPKLRGHHM